MPENTENYDLIATAQLAVEPAQLQEGIWLTHSGYQVTDLRDRIEKAQARPNRKKGFYTVTDVESFVAYVAKHGIPESELWANDKASTVSAVINAHQGETGADAAGWSDHIVTLQLAPTPDWKDWIGQNGRLVKQSEFAEFIEDHLPNFRTPTAADMLELAQTFQATTKVDFASSQRIKSGETQLTYTEDTNATAGKKGSLAIPDTFSLALQPYERGDTYKVDARFRYRINGGDLLLGYRLARPEDVLRDAFDAVVTKVAADTARSVWSTR